VSNIIFVLVSMLILTTSESFKVAGTFFSTRMFPEHFCQSCMFVYVIAVPCSNRTQGLLRPKTCGVQLLCFEASLTASTETYFVLDESLRD